MVKIRRPPEPETPSLFGGLVLCLRFIGSTFIRSARRLGPGLGNAVARPYEAVREDLGGTETVAAAPPPVPEELRGQLERQSMPDDQEGGRAD